MMIDIPVAVEISGVPRGGRTPRVETALRSAPFEIQEVSAAEAPVCARVWPGPAVRAEEPDELRVQAGRVYAPVRGPDAGSVLRAQDLSQLVGHGLEMAVAQGCSWRLLPVRASDAPPAFDETRWRSIDSVTRGGEYATAGMLFECRLIDGELHRAGTPALVVSTAERGASLMPGLLGGHEVEASRTVPSWGAGVAAHFALDRFDEALDCFGPSEREKATIARRPEIVGDLPPPEVDLLEFTLRRALAAILSTVSWAGRTVRLADFPDGLLVAFGKSRALLRDGKSSGELAGALKELCEEAAAFLPEGADAPGVGEVARLLALPGLAEGAVPRSCLPIFRM